MMSQLYKAPSLCSHNATMQPMTIEDDECVTCCSFDRHFVILHLIKILLIYKANAFAQICKQ